MMSHNFLLIKSGYYWRPNSAGYTGFKAEAGRYSYSEAKKRCEYGHSTMIKEEDAPEFSDSCCPHAKAQWLEKRPAQLEKQINREVTSTSWV